MILGGPSDSMRAAAATTPDALEQEAEAQAVGNDGEEHTGQVLLSGNV